MIHVCDEPLARVGLNGRRSNFRFDPGPPFFDRLGNSAVKGARDFSKRLDLSRRRQRKFLRYRHEVLREAAGETLMLCTAYKLAQFLLLISLAVAIDGN